VNLSFLRSLPNGNALSGQIICLLCDGGGRREAAVDWRSSSLCIELAKTLNVDQVNLLKLDAEPLSLAHPGGAAGWGAITASLDANCRRRRSLRSHSLLWRRLLTRS